MDVEATYPHITYEQLRQMGLVGTRGPAPKRPEIMQIANELGRTCLLQGINVSVLEQSYLETILSRYPAAIIASGGFRERIKRYAEAIV